MNTDGTDSAAVGALFPNISADGRYEVFESGWFNVKSGKTKKSVTTYNKNVKLSSVSYNSTTHVVTIFPASSLNLSLPEQLQITAALLTDAYGRALDGDHDGQPGGNLVATFSNKGDKIQ